MAVCALSIGRRSDLVVDGAGLEASGAPPPSADDAISGLALPRSTLQNLSRK
jgi:hypothetical protein